MLSLHVQEEIKKKKKAPKRIVFTSGPNQKVQNHHYIHFNQYTVFPATK